MMRLLAVEVLLLMLSVQICKVFATEPAFSYAQISGVREIVPMNGTYYTIANEVGTDGNYYTFTLFTDSKKQIEVIGIINLIKYTSEILTIEEFMNTPNGNQVWKGAKDSAKGMGGGFVKLFKHPGDAASESGKAFGRVGRRLGGGLTGIFKRKQKSSTGKDYAKRGNGLVGEHARSFAYELGIDAYSKNPVVYDALTSVAIKRWFGGQMVTISMSAGQGAPLLGMLAISVGKNDIAKDGYEKLLRNLPPAEVTRELEIKLMKLLGATEKSPEYKLVKKLLGNPNYTPRQKAYTVLYLQDFIGKSNFFDALFTMASVKTVEDADVVYSQLQLLNAYQKKTKSVAGFRSENGRIAGINHDGTAVIFLPYDHMEDNVNNRSELSALIPQQRNAELWIVGEVSASFRKYAESMGVQSIRTNILTSPMFQK